MRNSIILIAVFIVLSVLPCTAFGAATVSSIDAPHGAANGYTCANCHQNHVSLGTTGFNNICLNCHHPWTPIAGNKPFLPSDAADPFNVYTANSPEKRYQTSHRWSGSDTVPAAGALPPTFSAMTAVRTKTQGDLACVRCHNQHKNTYKPFLRMTNENDELCLDCHRSRNMQSHFGGSHPVGVQYSSAASKFSTPQNANPANPTSALKLKNGKVYCSTCHQVHYADSNSATFDNASGHAKLKPSQGFLLRTDLRGATAENSNICTNCHAGKKNHSNLNQNVQCADCHAGHVEYDPQDPKQSLGVNSYLIRRYMNVSSAAGAVRNKRVFHLHTTSGRYYKDANGTGVCQGCHVVPTGARYPAVHNSETATAKDCNLCHYHNNPKGAFTAAGSCNACHGYPPIAANLGGPNGLALPASNATNGAVGAHAAHVTGRAISCDACHSGYTTKGMPSYSMDMGFTVNGNTFTGFKGSVAGGTFSGSNGLDRQYTWSSTAGGTTVNTASGSDSTCANIYCHGATLTGGNNNTPSWTGSNQAVCGSCHGVTLASPPTAGSHQRHAGTLQLGCSVCHGTVSDTAHVDGSVRWNLSAIAPNATYTPAGKSGGVFGETNAVAPSAAYGTCNNVYCHSNVQGAGGTGSPSRYATPTWGSASVTCASCHTDMAQDASAPGSHVRHAQFAGYACSTCHTGAGSGTANHADGSIQISFDSRNPSGLYSQNPNNIPGNGYGSCSNTVCHGSSTPVWGSGPLSTDCTGCHGNDASSRSPLAAGKHRPHINNYSTLGRGNDFACVTCHASTVADNRHIANGRNHANGIKNYSGVRSGRIVVAGSGSCSSNYCHSTGRQQNQYWNMTAASWYSGRTLSCNGCHGTATLPDGTPAAFTSVAGEPNYVSGGPGSATANSHQAHVAGAGLTDSRGCAKCHAATVDAAVAGKLRDYSSAHLDARRSVTFSAQIQGRYSASSQQCLNTYCHGAAPSVKWGSTSLACNACHSAEATAFSANNAGAHKLHYQVLATPVAGSYASMVPGQGPAATASSYQFNCTSCHASPAVHASGEARTGVSAAQVYFGYSAQGLKGSYSYGTNQGTDNGFKWSNGSCSNTYCHSNGNGGPANNTNFTWGSPAGTLGCTGCHGGSAASNAPIASNKHSQHINNAAMLGAGNSFSCVECHAKTVVQNGDGSIALGDKRNHVNRFKDFSGVRAGGSASYAANSCSATYCHSSGKKGLGVASEPAAPVWTSTGTLGCDGCHGIGTGIGYPNYASGGAGSSGANSHGAHVTALSITDTKGCAKCHNTTVDAASSGKLRDYSSAHLNGSITVRLAASVGGSYSATDKSCSNVYCHSNGQSGTPSATPTPQWGASLTCKSCHGFDAASGNAIASNRHLNHIDNASVVGRKLRCQECHNATTTDSTSIATRLNHVNQQVNVKFENGAGINRDADGPSYNGNLTTGPAGAAKAAGSTAGSCTNVYCHSDGNATPAFRTIAWDSNWSGSKCVNCHGNGTSRAHNSPDVNAPGAVNANSHVRHVEVKGFSCDKCHASTTADSAAYPALPGSVIVGGAHLDRSKSVSFRVFSSTAGNYASADKTCSNVYCHSDGNGGAANRTAQWGDKLNCRGCHGGDATSASPITSGKHAQHTNNAALLGTGNNFACAECHAKTVAFASNTSIISQRNHVNRLKDYSGAKSGKVISAGSGQCSSNYCHSSGQKAAVATYWNMTAASWYSNRTLDCTGCHGNAAAPGFAAVAGAPNYVNGGAGSDSANSHQRHVAGAGITDSTGCAKCHYKTVDGTSANKLRNFSSLHLNRVRDVSFSAAASIAGVQGRYSSTSQQCMNTYCHGSNPSVKWGSTALACNACHSAEVTAFTANNAGAHKLHYQVATPPASGSYASMTPGQGSAASATSYQFNCTSCHATPAQHAGGEAIPGLSAAQVYFGYSAAGRKGSYLNGTLQGADNGFKWSNGSCSSTYCHSNGQGGNPANTSFTWASPAGTLGCNGCHGDAAASTTLSGAHSRHVNNASFLGTNFACSECHAKTVSGSSAIANKLNHVNGFKDFSGAKAYRTGYVGGDCTNYCHSSGKPGIIPSAAEPIAPNWTAGVTLDCRGCHGRTSSIAGEPDYASLGAAQAGSNSHQKHVKGAADCVKCHVKTTANGTAISAGSVNHLNQHIDVALSKVSSYTNFSGVYDSSTKSCSATYCHGGLGSSPSWGGSTTCESCHNATGAELSGRHDKHLNTATPFTNITGSSRHSATAYVFGCKNCHVTTSHASGPASANRVAEIGTGGASKISAYNEGGASGTDPRGYAYTTGTCTTVCHTRDGVNTPVLSSFDWSTSVTGSNCGICHNKAGDAAPVWSTPHTKHVNVYGAANGNFTCNTCHAGTASDSSTINGAAGRNQHPNGVKNIQFNGFAGGTWSGTQCSNTYCHSNGTSVVTPGHAAISWSAPPVITCGSCHGGTGTGPDYANGAPKANSHSKHVAFSGFTCDKCHFNTTTDGSSIANRSLHLNKGYDIAAGTGVSFTVAPGTGSISAPALCNNISCHGGNSATWGGTLHCQNCHGDDTADLDNFAGTFWNNGTLGKIRIAGEWDATGHGKANGNYASGNPAAAFTGVGACEFCHEPGVPHKVGSNAFRLKNYSTAAWGRNAPCMVCHAVDAVGVTVAGVTRNRTESGAINARHFGAKHGGGNGNGGQFCWDCHDPHGDTNIYMIHDKVAKSSDPVTGAPTASATAVFSAAETGTDYATSTAPFTGICNTCHSATKHYTATAGDGHNRQTPCTECHNHNFSSYNNAFKPLGNCNSCHGYPPVRQGLAAGTVFRQNNYSTARFEDYSGGGGAHTIEKHVKATAKANEGWVNCKGCHSKGAMDPISHTMIVPVEPSQITVDADPRYKFDHRRGLGPQRYSGKLTDNYDNATGSCSNIKCHFRPSKKWSSGK